MKVKITILLLSILFSSGSLNAYCHQRYSSGEHQIKATTESINAAIAPSFAFEERELAHFPFAILVNFADARAYAWQKSVIYFSPSIRKSVKTYIVFRTLRN